LAWAGKPAWSAGAIVGRAADGEDRPVGGVAEPRRPPEHLTGMRPGLRFAAALLAAVALTPALAGAAFACSCVMPEALGAYVARDPTIAVFAGTAGPTTRDRTAFAIERWFAGPGSAGVIALVPATIDLGNGQVSGNTCGLDLPAGSRWILAAPRGADGSFTPSVCLPNARLGTAEGAALLAEAEQTFGPGMAPATPSLASPPGEPEPVQGEHLPLVLAMLAGGLAAALLGGAVVLALRRRR